MMDNEESPDPNEEENTVYFKLLQAVGTRGLYQTLLILFTILLAFPNGVASLNSSYTFAVPSYTQCPPPHQGISLCTKYVCSLPLSQRSQYEQRQIKQLKTIGTQFGDYHCSKKDEVEYAKGTYFLGAIAGFVVVGLMSDNLGRRASLLFALLIGIGGYLAMLLSSSLAMAGIAHFIVGFSCESVFNLTMCYLAEMLDDERRMKMQILVQAFVPFSGVIHVFGLMFLKEWKTIFLLLCLVPTLVGLIWCYFFVIDTPFFLVKRLEVENIRQNLRFVARVNEKEDEFESNQLVSYVHILDLKEEYNKEIKSQHKVTFTFLDLFWYPSLRFTTIVAMVYCFTSNVIYYIPSMLIDQIGFDFYFNGIIVNSSDLTTYLLTFYLITRAHRRPINIISSLVALVSSFILIFVHKCDGEDCSNSKGLEMVLIFLMKFAGAILNQIMYIYIAELFPIQVRGMGLSMCCIFGMFPNAFLPEVINIMNKKNWNVILLGTLVSLVAIVVSWAAPETFGVHPQERVEEIHHGKHQEQYEFTSLPEEQS